MQDLREFIVFLKDYSKTRLINFGKQFENLKDIIVALLIAKRGKYSFHFLNSSFFVLTAAVLIVGPTIAENNPFISSLQGNNTYLAGVVSYNPYDNSLSTIISVKPRDKIENYEVREGDTLESIAEKFEISVDTVKWANNLKTDIINQGDILKILPITGVVHKVVSGDNVYSIAKKYGTDAQKIVNFPFNDFEDLETFSLVVGQTLYVPDGVIEAEQPKYLAQRVVTQIQAGVKGTSNFIWPTSGGISQSPVWYHMALDITNSPGTSILTSDTGTVTYAGCLNWGYGCHIIVDHANGYQTLYAHLNSIGVAVGQAVTQGQQIGLMGSTGRSTGPHLHFEVRSGGTLMNPLEFLK